ncbi:MAG: FecR domain-containing protein [Pseudomonadota bacterium]
MTDHPADYSAHLRQVTSAAHAWRARLNAPGVSQADKLAFETWLRADVRHEEAYDRAITLWSAYDHLSQDSIADDLCKPSVREHWYGFKSAAVRALQPAYVRIITACCVAAALAVPIGLKLTTQRGALQYTVASRELETKRGETKTVALADGSRVTLGPQSKMATHFDTRKRMVTLISGAALFDVAKDPSKPFSVKTDDLVATALGTVFDVRKSGDVSRIAVSEGQVRVAAPLSMDGQKFSLETKIVLTVGQQVAATPRSGLRMVQQIASDKVGAWRAGQLIYDGATLTEIIADANRYSDAHIMLSGDPEDFAHLTLTASFSAHDIERMLDLVALSVPIEIDRRQPGQIVLTPRAAQ